jgi:hypothetical protein
MNYLVTFNYSNFAWYVGKDNHNRISREDVQCDRMETWLGIWSC